MRSHIFVSKIDYAQFDNPYAGIAAMIFVQAANDYEKAKNKGYFKQEGCHVYISEVESFFGSEWAEYLAEEMKLDSRDVRAYPARSNSKEKKNES